MRVLISYGLVGRGGDAIQVLALAEAFKAYGHNVELLGATPLTPYAFSGAGGSLRNVARRLPWWARDLIELGLSVRILWRAGNRLRRGRFDLVFHRAGIYDFVGSWLARSCSVVGHLDAPFPIERAYRGEGCFSRLHRYCMRRLGARAMAIVTGSQASRDYYAKLGIPQEKILVLPNGVSTHLLQKGRELAEAHPPFAKSRPVTVGFVGSLSRWHRVDVLLEALHILNAERAGAFRLEVVGFGEDYSTLRALEKKLGLEGRVTWVGAVPHQEAFERVSRFDVAVLPHTLTTGAPIKLFEYAAVARPTIAPDLPNLRSLFTEEEMCFVKPADPEALAGAVLNFVGDPERARTMGLKAQARVARDYTWEQIVTRVLDAVAARTLGDVNTLGKQG